MLSLADPKLVPTAETDTQEDEEDLISEDNEVVDSLPVAVEVEVLLVVEARAKLPPPDLPPNCRPYPSYPQNRHCTILSFPVLLRH